MLLYKYADIDHLDIVANRSDRFTPVAAFNDPFKAPIPQIENNAERVRFKLVDRIVDSFIGVAKAIESAMKEAKLKTEQESGRYLVKMLKAHLNDLSTDAQNLVRRSSDWKKLLSLARKANLDNENWWEDFARYLLALDSQLKNFVVNQNPLTELTTS